MIFETLISELIEQLGGENSLIFLEKDNELIMEFQTGLIVKITHEEVGDLDMIGINAELGDIPDNSQCLIALLMANKHQLEDNKTVFSINAENEKVNCTIALNVENSQASTILEQLKKFVSYQEWFASFQDESKNSSADNSYNEFNLANRHHHFY